MSIQLVSIKISFILFFTKNSAVKTGFLFHAFFLQGITPIIHMLQPVLFPINHLRYSSRATGITFLFFSVFNPLKYMMYAFIPAGGDNPVFHFFRILSIASFLCIFNKKIRKKKKMKTAHEQNWYVYLAECSDKSLYCGITANLIRRFQQHNGIRKGGAKYTQSRRPVTLLAYQGLMQKSQALKLEITIKNLPKNQKLTFLQNLHGVL
jgi:Predicted endonuclease containing a URI domain